MEQAQQKGTLFAKTTWWHSPQTPTKNFDMKYKETNKTRTINIHFRVTSHEQDLIRQRMDTCGIKNMARYLRLKAINGCIINPDYSELKARNSLPSLSYNTSLNLWLP